MKKLFIFLLATAPLLALAQKEQPYRTQSFSGQPVQKLVSQTSGGNISVTGGSDTRVEVYVRGNNGKLYSNQEIESRLNEDYTLTVELKDQVLTATCKPKNKLTNWKKALSVSFVISVPQQTATDLKTSGGNIHLSHLKGQQDFTTSGGNLIVDDLDGHIVGRTSGGNIHLTNSKNTITLTTSGGNIHAENSDGDMKLSTSGGNIDITGLAGNVQATTSGGSIRIDKVNGDLSAHTSGGNVRVNAVAGSLDASTSGGNITAAVTETGKFVKLRNSGGSIDLELPNKGFDLDLSGGKVKLNTTSNFSGKLEEDRIEGKLNGGGVPVTVKTSSGRLSVTIK